eukprot:gene21623-24519_t
MVPMTKKFSVGVIPIYLINNRNEPYPSFIIWGMFLGAMIGCGCALIGCILPFPVRLASTELRERIEYYSVSMSSLLKDLTQSWFDTYKIKDSHDQSQLNHGVFDAPLSNQPQSSNNSPIISGKKSTVRPFASKVCNSTTNLLDTGDRDTTERLSFRIRNPSVPLQNPHWRKLRLIVLTIGAFKYRQCSMHRERGLYLRRGSPPRN